MKGLKKGISIARAKAERNATPNQGEKQPKTLENQKKRCCLIANRPFMLFMSFMVDALASPYGVRRFSAVPSYHYTSRTRSAWLAFT